MKLIALLIGLAVERLATQLFHLRELRWLDRVIDRGFEQVNRFANWPPLLLVVLLAAVLVLPVVLVRLLLGDALFGFPYLLFAVVVLFFSFGPKDIGEEVNEYCAALESGDEERIRRSGKALLERDPPPTSDVGVSAIEAAVCVQANNRLFAVIFWFLFFGPAGALLYRLSFLYANTEEGAGAKRWLWALEWLPVRLLGVSFAITGNFVGCLNRWKRQAISAISTSTEVLRESVLGALSVDDELMQSCDCTQREVAALKRLYARTLWFWITCLALWVLLQA